MRKWNIFLIGVLSALSVSWTTASLGAAEEENSLTSFSTRVLPKDRLWIFCTVSANGNFLVVTSS